MVQSASWRRSTRVFFVAAWLPSAERTFNGVVGSACECGAAVPSTYLVGTYLVPRTHQPSKRWMHDAVYLRLPKAQSAPRSTAMCVETRVKHAPIMQRLAPCLFVVFGIGRYTGSRLHLSWRTHLLSRRILAKRPSVAFEPQVLLAARACWCGFGRRWILPPLSCTNCRHSVIPPRLTWSMSNGTTWLHST